MTKKRATKTASKKSIPRGAYQRALEALKRAPGDHDKIIEVCKHIGTSKKGAA